MTQKHLEGSPCAVLRGSSRRSRHQIALERRLVLSSTVISVTNQPHWASAFGADGANKLVNQFAGDCFRPFNSGCSDFWI